MGFDSSRAASSAEGTPVDFGRMSTRPAFCACNSESMIVMSYYARCLAKDGCKSTKTLVKLKLLSATFERGVAKEEA